VAAFRQVTSDAGAQAALALVDGGENQVVSRQLLGTTEEYGRVLAGVLVGRDDTMPGNALLISRWIISRCSVVLASRPGDRPRRTRLRSRWDTGTR
jgi:hypothetical protein